MPSWITQIDLTDLYADMAEGRRTIAEVSQEIANRIERNLYANELTDIIQMFRRARVPREVDDALRKLWDFGDLGRRIFVKVEEEKDPAYLN